MKAASGNLKTPRNYWIDLTRLIMALFVVGVHATRKASWASGPYQWLTILNPTLFRAAVPFFFLCTAFFTYQAYLRTNRDPKVFFKAALRYFIMYTIWVIIFIPTILKESYFGGSKSASEYAILFIKQFFLDAPISVFWFLRACAYGLVFLGVLAWLKIKPIYVLPLAIAAYVYGVYGDGWYGLLGDDMKSVYVQYFATFYRTRNAFFMAIPFLVVGAEIAEVHEDKKPSTPLAILAAVGTVLSGLALYFEAQYVVVGKYARDYNMYFSLMLLAPLLFIALINIKAPCRLAGARYWGPLSSLIYFTHIAWRDFYQDVWPLKTTLGDNLAFKVLFVIILSALMSGLILYITRHWKAKKWLY